MAFELYDERNRLRPAITFAVMLVLAVSAAWVLVYSYALNTVNVGQSMEPTIENDETVLIDRVCYHFSRPARYDVIAYDQKIAGTGEDTDIKRIIGLPGERICIRDGHVLINGQMLTEGGQFDQVQLAGIAADEIELGEGEYFVLGDKRQSSEDSRFENIGNIPEEAVIGRVWLRIQPLKRLGYIE